ncbi:TIGR01906 family membrane protein [Eubacteriales bacterium OttesenSCG-928-N14]|nr:TIGR01906 family membrane protein [Eubacteriales bacterium OttesenSCG-928-N14]
MNKWPRRLALFAGMLLTVALIVAAICSAAFDHALYHRIIVQNGIDADLQMEMQDVDVVTRVLIDYCKGSRDDLDVVVPINGVEQPFFNEKEIMHMKDVQVLFRFAKWLLLLSALGAAILIAISGSRSGWDMPLLLKQCAKGIGIILGIIAVVALFAVFDFSTFWTLFHYVFMWNDLWLLNPATDLLIVLMPLRFFIGICTTIVLRFGIGLAVCIAIGVVINTVYQRKRIV